MATHKRFPLDVQINDIIHTFSDLKEIYLGFTILDEVHHISSEVFSNALFKIVTKYMLGLSATLERKDIVHNASFFFVNYNLNKIFLHYLYYDQWNYQFVQLSIRLI